MKVLGGMIHCQFVSPEEIEGIIGNFQRTLRPEDGGQLVTRHGAVLGLCSVVTAFPHTVPPLVPPLLVYLGRFLHDKQPIPGPNPSHLSLNTDSIVLFQPPSRRVSRAGRELTRTTGVSTRRPSLRTNWRR